MMSLQSDGVAANSLACEEAVLLPMAITRVDAEHGCVSALTMEGRWLRPGPVFAAELESPQSNYAFRRPYRCRISPSTSADRRPEDRALLGYVDGPRISLQMNEERLLAWYLAHSDADATTSFTGERSVGLIEVTPERVYLQRSTQQRFFVRMAFKDGSGTAYDWIVPDVPFSRYALALLRDAADPAQAGASLLQRMQQSRVLLTIVLSKPINRARGIFRGCQPLVGGVHTFPDYAQEILHATAA